MPSTDTYHRAMPASSAHLPERCPVATHGMTWLGLALMVSGWIWLFVPTLRWLWKTLSHQDFRLHLVLLLGIAAMLAKHWHDQRRHAQRMGTSTGRLADLTPSFRISILPLALLLTSALMYLLIERWWDIDILAATCFGLGSYGMIGLWITPQRWRRGFPAALLLIAALPFGTHMEQLVGFPARVLTAQWSSQLLAAAGIGSLSTQSILVLENGIAHVDLPCSGIKSLWSGAIFFLALTWIERAALRLRWFLVGIVFVAALIAANIARVCILILVAIVAQQPQIAEIIHVPLGVVGCCVAGGIAYLLLRNQQAAPPPQATKENTQLYPMIGLFGLVAVIWILGALHLSRPVSAGPALQWKPTFAPGFVQQKLPLTRAEQDLFTRHGQAQAHKLRFRWRHLQGSILLVYSKSWRSHHPPEICLAGNGHKVKSLRSIRLQPDFSIRHITLAHRNHNAVYWYQSHKRATDLLWQRILGSLHKQERRWVMVSIFVDQPIQPQQAKTKALFMEIYKEIHHSFLAK